jgi:hypothetical protein
MNSQAISLETSLEEFIQYQYTANSTLDLRTFCSLSDFSGYIIHPDLLRFIQQERKRIVGFFQQEIADLVQSSRHGLIYFLVTRTQKYLYDNNQFIRISRVEREALQHLYSQYLADILAALMSFDTCTDFASGFARVITRHLDALQQFVFRLGRTERGVNASLIPNPVVCAEYSPELQLRILGIQVTDVIQPILDVGCGFHGNLVQYLRSIGIEAYGVDRVVGRNTYLLEADWSDLELGEHKWGTIVSHMAFSHHFMFHHNYIYGTPEKYAATYRNLLNALQVGGTLYYAPTLPFIEPFVPDSFRVQVHSFHPADEQVRATSIKRLR